MALSVFWVCSCPHEASGGGGDRGPTKLPTAGRFGKEGGDVFSSGVCVCGERLRAFSKLVELPSASCCGALSTHCGVVSLVTHSHQTSPWKLSG